MTSLTPDPEDPPAARRVRQLSRVFAGSGWSRTLPPRTVALLAPLVAEGPKTRGQLEDALSVRRRPADAIGLATPAWAPLPEWSAPALHRATPPGESAPAVEQVRRAERRNRARHVSNLDAYADALDVHHVDTLGDLLDLVTAAVSRDSTSAAGTPST